MPNPIRVVQNGEVYEITFKYDPTMVHLIKQVPGKAWNPKAKMWTIPRDRLGFLISQLKGTMYESMLQIFSDEQINVNASLPTNDEIPDIDISNVKTYVKDGGHLFKHQEDFMKYSIARQMSGNSHGFILADQPGLGKALDLDTKIYTPTGYKLMRDIQVGDKVFNEMGEPVEVLATYDHQNLEMYRVTFSDGASVVCCKDHLWEVYDEPHCATLTTSQILDMDYSTLWIPYTEPVQFENDYLDTLKVCPRIKILALNIVLHPKTTSEVDIPVEDFDKNGWSLEDSIEYCQSQGLEVICNVNNRYECYEFSIRKGKKRFIKSIERVEARPGKCITVSGPSHLYLCEHFIVAHNTIEVMNLAIYNKSFYKYKHVLIIACVNAAKYHWQEDIYTHSNHQYLPYILGTRKKKNGMLRFDTGSKEKLEDLTSTRLFSESGKGSKGLPYFCIINIEAIRTKQGRKYPIADRIIELCERGYFGMIAIDEVHKNCSPSSLQGKQLLRIKKAVKDKVMFIPMTGTPIVSRPTDAFLPLKLVDGHDFNSFYSWCQQFCVYGGFGGHEIVAYKNIDKLNDMMKYNMLRRRKQDVMDLPPKIHHTEYVENTPYQQKLYNVVAQDLITNRNIVLAHMNPLSRLLRLRQVNGAPELIDKDLVVGKDYMKYNAKISRILDLLEDIHERGEKVVIFSNWVESLRTLYRFISKKYKVCCYTGTMKEADREEHKRRFIEDPNYTVIIGTIGALGTMHNLQVATNVIFLDEPWTAADKEQAEDRCHRSVSTEPINIYTIITKGTVDERVHNIVYTKEGVANYIVDGELDLHSHPELFDLLLADTIKNQNISEQELLGYDEIEE